MIYTIGMTNTTTTQLPAFRITRGDIVTIERRRYRVAHIGLVSRIPRRRDVPRPDPLVSFTLSPASGRGNRRTVNVEQTDLIRVAR